MDNVATMGSVFPLWVVAIVQGDRVNPDVADAWNSSVIPVSVRSVPRYPDG